MKILVSILFLPHMVERVQVKVFFCFPASEVPTFVGSLDGRESQLASEVLTAGSPSVRWEFRRRSNYAASVTRLLYNRPRPIFFTVVSLPLPTSTPPWLLLAPPHRALPSHRRPTSSSGLLLSSSAAGGLAGSADRPPSLPSTARALVFFGLW